jgi:hypothetical protein
MSDNWCVIYGTPGATPLTIEGPFADKAEAEAMCAESQKDRPQLAAMVDVLTAPKRDSNPTPSDA